MSKISNEPLIVYTKDLETGVWSGMGSESLCAVFEDPEFNPAGAAYYYMRAVEVLTLCWRWAQCMALPESDRPEECNNDAPKTIQEMVWTSPIWYLSGEQGGMSYASKSQ